MGFGGLNYTFKCLMKCFDSTRPKYCQFFRASCLLTNSLYRPQMDYTMQLYVDENGDVFGVGWELLNVWHSFIHTYKLLSKYHLLPSSSNYDTQHMIHFTSNIKTSYHLNTYAFTIINLPLKITYNLKKHHIAFEKCTQYFYIKNEHLASISNMYEKNQHILDIFTIKKKHTHCFVKCGYASVPTCHCSFTRQHQRYMAT